MYKELTSIVFPKYQGDINVNMMPFIFGENRSIPGYLQEYCSIIEKCNLKQGDIAYLTINEGFIKKGNTQRRPGIHTDAFTDGGWGGGNWGKNGIFLASNDGSCKVWNSTTHEVDNHGGLLFQPTGTSEMMKPNKLYWLTDRTPHEALPVKTDINRQFFRVVSKDIDVWWEQHSTPNPLGVKPNCKILTHSKF